jgi:hypothetical protein
VELLFKKVLIHKKFNGYVLMSLHSSDRYLVYERYELDFLLKAHKKVESQKVEDFIENKSDLQLAFI